MHLLINLINFNIKNYIMVKSGKSIANSEFHKINPSKEFLHREKLTAIWAIYFNIYWADSIENICTKMSL